MRTLLIWLCLASFGYADAIWTEFSGLPPYAATQGTGTLDVLGAVTVIGDGELELNTTPVGWDFSTLEIRDLLDLPQLVLTYDVRAEAGAPTEITWAGIGSAAITEGENTHQFALPDNSTLTASFSGAAGTASLFFDDVRVVPEPTWINLIWLLLLWRRRCVHT